MNPLVTIGKFVRRKGAAFPFAVLRCVEEFGFASADLVTPPPRLWGTEQAPATVEPSQDLRRLQADPTPVQLLGSLPKDDNWMAQTRRSLARLTAYFLICEDPQRRLDSRPIHTLAHQASLVRHVLEDPQLERVLIGDEVGLGKTIEAGLILQELLEQRPNLRILYLAPARLVRNVRSELDKLDVGARQWTSAESDARLDDPRIVASIHRAVHKSHFDSLTSTAPWDVLVVDECHHLSDWAEGGGDPTQKYRLVEKLVEQQREGGRVLLLSGTPHQGHRARFENLLGLLRKKDESEETLRGRVIYRTKEDVTDWEGRPLFPGRQVNDPIVVDLGPDHRAWLELIREYFDPSEAANASEARQRAAGWRCAQALQWAASSPQAGLGYLVRQAIRAGWTLEEDSLREAIASLRPYRTGPADEPIADLYQRLEKEIQRQQNDADIEDIEEVLDVAAPLADPNLAELLRQGLEVLRQSADAKWEKLRTLVLEPAGTEKVVLFAQPIETVMALAGYLKRIEGQTPALILGGQSDSDREKQVLDFRDPNGPRYLVSSKAGGEGINLQVARRIVHLDVPWNPMEMEQRVGRVHRFGSRNTILVDTLVVKDSREVDAYRVAREKLQLIASTVVEPERFEALFSRVMCLIPPEGLIHVMGDRPSQPLNLHDQERLGQLVQDGYRRWSEFHENYAKEQSRIQQLDPGQARWEDLAHCLRDHAQAQDEKGYTAERFIWKEGQAEPVAEPAHVLRLKDNQVYACGDYSGTRVLAPNRIPAKQLGTNIPFVSQKLRELAWPIAASGAAHLGVPRTLQLPEKLAVPLGILVMLRQTVRPATSGGYTELNSQLRWYAITTNGDSIEVEGATKGELFRKLLDCTIRARPQASPPLEDHLQQLETELTQVLIRPTDTDREHNHRHAVTPLFAAILTRV